MPQRVDPGGFPVSVAASSRAPGPQNSAALRAFCCQPAGHYRLTNAEGGWIGLFATGADDTARTIDPSRCKPPQVCPACSPATRLRRLCISSGRVSARALPGPGDTHHQAASRRVSGPDCHSWIRSRSRRSTWRQPEGKIAVNGSFPPRTSLTTKRTYNATRRHARPRGDGLLTTLRPLFLARRSIRT